MPELKFSGVVDRISGGKAVILLPGEDEMLIPETILPEGASEGSAIAFSASLDRAEESRRLQRAEELRNALKKRKEAREDAD